MDYGTTTSGSEETTNEKFDHVEDVSVFQAELKKNEILEADSSDRNSSCQNEACYEIALVKQQEKSNFGTLEKKSFLDVKDIIWKIPSHFIEPMEVGHWKESPVFSFLDENWCLRIYMNEKKFGEDSKISMCLVRFNTYSVVYFIAYELSILDTYGNWLKFKKCGCQDICQSNVTELGVSELHFPPDGYVTLYFQMLLKDRLTEASIYTVKPESKLEFQMNCMESYGVSLMQYGELHERPFFAAAEVTWKIPDFFQLRKEEYNNIDSPVFNFANNTWLLQFYPNGCGKAGIISFVLRLSSAIKCHIICHIFIKNFSNTISICMLDKIFESESAESDPVHLELSEIMNKPEKNIPNGILTVFCQMYVIEENEDPKHFEPATNKDFCIDDMVDLEEHKALFSDRFKNKSQEIVSKDDVNSSSDGKYVNKDLDELDFTLLKKKKKKKNIKTDTYISVDAMVDFKQNKSSISHNEDFSNKPQDIVSEEDINIPDSGRDVNKDLDDLDFSLCKKKKKKKKIEIDTDISIDAMVDYKQEINSMPLYEDSCSNSQDLVSKNEEICTSGRDVNKILDDFDFSWQKKKKKKKNTKTTSSIQQDSGTVPLDEKDHDVRFLVRGEEIRSDLAAFKNQSTFFESIIDLEIFKCSSMVIIDDSDPQMFKVFLHYLYTGNLDVLTTKNVFGLYSVASKYGIEKLKTECLQCMKNTLSVDTICDILAFSLHQKEVDIVELATDFFAKNATEIASTTKWENFLKANYIFASKLLEKVPKM